MQTPARLSPEQFDSRKELFLACKTDPHPGGGYYCRDCGSKIEYKPCAVSIHNRKFTACTNSGQEPWNVLVPYCPRCESEPVTVGCLHVNVERLNGNSSKWKRFWRWFTEWRYSESSNPEGRRTGSRRMVSYGHRN